MKKQRVGSQTPVIGTGMASGIADLKHVASTSFSPRLPQPHSMTRYLNRLQVMHEAMVSDFSYIHSTQDNYCVKENA